MNRNRAIALYLLGTLGQIWLICIIVFILRNLGIGVDYTTLIGMVAIGIGGVSSALWGTVIAIRYKKYSMKKIIKDLVMFLYQIKNLRLFQLNQDQCYNQWIWMLISQL